MLSARFKCWSFRSRPSRGKLGLCSVVMSAAIVLAAPCVVSAGMPSVTLTDIATMRLEAISFFLVGFLASAWIIQRLWNSVVCELAKLPRLTYGKANLANENKRRLAEFHIRRGFWVPQVDETRADAVF